MRLLALDQASRTSGYAVFIDDELTDYGKFTFEDADMGERLHNIREKVAQLIADHGIDYVAFEDIQMQGNITNNVQTFRVLAEVFGVIYELVTGLGIPHTAVLAGTWKSTLGIKGYARAEQKKNAQEYVLNTYGVKAIQDVCDAICIGAHILKKKPTPIVTESFDWS